MSNVSVLSPLGAAKPRKASGFVEKVVSGVVMVDPLRVSEFAGCLDQLISHENFSQLEARGDHISDDGYWPAADSWEVPYKPYNVRDGVLQIPVMGALINRMAYQVGRYATGYTYIEKAFTRGMEDANVKAIAFVVDSPGGEAAGNFELVDKIFAARGQKPVKAFVADAAYSGGYSIASAADEIIVTRSGGTGSVGVVTMHVDMSEYLGKIGLKVTFIQAGKHKTDGNSMQPLSAGAEERIQKRIDKTYAVFTSTIARNRAIVEGEVRATEALTYDAEDSISVGFADRIGALEEELASFALEVAQANGDDPMTTNPKDAPADMISVQAHEAAVAAARTEGAQAERQRFSDVLSNENYAGREALATKMLSTTALSSKEITDLLVTAPKTAPEKVEKEKQEPEKVSGGPNHFKERMDAEGGPGVGGNGGGDDPQVNSPAANTARIMAAHQAATGTAPKK